jgi:mono/diheme cytochrome c family protein
MSHKKVLALSILVILTCFLTACGGDKPDPTPLPYTPKVWDTESADTTVSIVGDPEAGAVIFEEHCASCHSLEQGENIAGPSLFAAGDDLSYDYIKESIGYPHEVIATVENPQFVDAEMPNNFLEVFSEQELEDIVSYILIQSKYGGTEKQD